MKKPMAVILGVTLALILGLFQNCDSLQREAVSSAPEVSGNAGGFDYGKSGNLAYGVHLLSNSSHDLTVFIPDEARHSPLPVVFFTHGFGAEDWHHYSGLIDYITKKGFILVYPAYPTSGSTVAERYNIVFAGFELAVAQFGTQMDLTKVGFMGHSFGGGASPVMAYRGLVEQGWGSNGAFVFAMAPWYTYEISTVQLQSFPDHLVLMEQVYQDDTTNDHRMAIDIYQTINVPAINKFYHFVDSMVYDGVKILAEHDAPGDTSADTLRAGALYNTFDALADYAFNHRDEGHQWLVSPVPTDKTYMPIEVESVPAPRYPEDRYKVLGGVLGGPWSSTLNPRRNENSF